MLGSHWMYRVWASYLYEELIGSDFDLGLSYSRDSVFLQFRSKGHRKAFELKFVNGFLIILPSHPLREHSKKKTNAVVQFKELSKQTVKDIGYAPIDRVLTIKFQNEYQLVLKGFGKFSNILLYNQNEPFPLAIFRLNLKKDWSVDKKVIIEDIQWLQSKENNILPTDNIDEWNTQFPALKWEQIPSKWFNKNQFEASQSSLRIKELTNPENYYFHINSNKNKIDFELNKQEPREVLLIYQELESCIREYLRTYFFIEQEKQIKNLISKKIKSLSSNLKNITKRKDALKKQRSFRELGDLIMANAHSIKAGVSEALITDFFTNQRIRVKLDPKLSSAENAQKFYRKSKNERLEWDFVTIHEKNTQDELDHLLDLQKRIDSAKNGKELNEIKQQLHPEKEVKKQTNTATYRSLRLGELEIWLGKNAKSNDELLRKASKNDLWFHAADVSGSHVLARTNGKVLNKTQLEKVAQLAAFHSKGRSQPIQTVQYTKRKFLSKPKNGAAGAVKSSQFETIDVIPTDLKL